MKLDSGSLLQRTASWTRVPGKHEVFCKDPGFLLAAAQTLHILHENLSVLWDTTYILIKPDALVGRKASAALRFVTDEGFLVIDAISMAVSEQQALNMWRYQWNRATQSRMQLSLAIATCGPSILLALKRPASFDPCPASVNLWAKKGSAFPDKRTADTLRSLLAVNGRYFGYVHIPDEPIDVVRECGNLLGAAGLSDLLRRLVAPELKNHYAAASKLIAQFDTAATQNHYDFNLPSALTASADMPAADDIQQIIDALFAKATQSRITDTVVFTTEDWMQLQNVTRHVTDNVDGIKAVVDSGDITNPRLLWSGTHA